MTTHIDFGALVFFPLDWPHFVRRYRGEVRATVLWDKMKRARTGIRLLSPGEKVLSVWYKGGDWRDGKPIKFTPGREFAMVRLPAVRLRDKYLLLDGCHRMAKLCPAIVLIDWFEPRAADRKYMNDLFNPHFARIR